MKVKGSLIFPLWPFTYNNNYNTFEFQKPSEYITLNIDGEFSTLTELLEYITKYTKRDQTRIWGSNTWHFL